MKDKSTGVRYNSLQGSSLDEAGYTIQSFLDEKLEQCFPVSLDLPVVYSLSYSYRKIKYSFRTTDKGNYGYFKGILELLSISVLKEEVLHELRPMSNTESNMVLKLYQKKDQLNQI